MVSPAVSFSYIKQRIMVHNVVRSAGSLIMSEHEKSHEMIRRGKESHGDLQLLVSLTRHTPFGALSVAKHGQL